MCNIMCVALPSLLNKGCMLWLCCDAIDVSIHIGMPCVRVSYLICMGFDYLVVNFSSTPHKEMPLCDPTSHGSSLLLRTHWLTGMCPS